MIEDLTPRVAALEDAETVDPDAFTALTTRVGNAESATTSLTTRVGTEEEKVLTLEEEVDDL